MLKQLKQQQTRARVLLLISNFLHLKNAKYREARKPPGWCETAGCMRDAGKLRPDGTGAVPGLPPADVDEGGIPTAGTPRLASGGTAGVDGCRLGP